MYDNTYQIVHEPLNTDLAAAALQGTNLAHAIWLWAQTLQWPVHPVQNNSVTHWGISWVEPLFNFVICTGFIVPIKVSGEGQMANYCPYFSDDASLLPTSNRAVGGLSFQFQAACRGIASLSNLSMFPSETKQSCASLYHFGFRGKIPGFASRPVLRQQSRTMLAISEYIKSLPSQKALSLPFPKLDLNPCVTFERYHEPDAKTRFANYQRLKKSQYRRR